jgi:nucleotide-binding universal stress UspA family protein
MLPPKLILSPLDFSDPSHEALDVAADLASRFGSELLLLHIVPMIPKLPSGVSIFKEGDYERELIQNAEAKLEDLVKKYAAKGIRARWQTGLANDAGMEIIRAADHEKVDLIVIATHGMTGWRRLAFGSVTEKVVRTATAPVLVLRSGAAAESSDSSAQAKSVAAAN